MSGEKIIEFILLGINGKGGNTHDKKVLLTPILCHLVPPHQKNGKNKSKNCTNGEKKLV